jgi:DNA-binding NarL/FixJ family response regulator
MELPEGFGRLTLSERAVLRLLSELLTTRQIAERLALRERTVENRRCAVAQKLGLGGSRTLARFAYEHRSLLRNDAPGPPPRAVT